MFEHLRAWIHRKTAPPRPTPATGLPFDASLPHRTWVVIKADGRIAYLDHQKADGRFGVRPVDPDTAAHYPNPSLHWTPEQRRQVPEEMSLSTEEFRHAEPTELPSVLRLGG